MPLRDIIQLANLINKVRQKIYIHWNAIAQTYKSANRKIHGPAKNRPAGPAKKEVRPKAGPSDPCPKKWSGQSRTCRTYSYAYVMYKAQLIFSHTQYYEILKKHSHTDPPLAGPEGQLC